MRLPNSYGGIVKLSGNRRRPYRVRITDRWEITPDGKKKQIYKTIGYYETREDALNALAEYHKIPLVKPHELTLMDVYDMWSAETYPTLSASAIRTHETSIKICEPICRLPFVDLRLAHLQGVIDGCGKNMPVLIKVKSTLRQIYTYAQKHDFCAKNYAGYINLSKHQTTIPEEKKHRIFTSEEVRCLWEHYDNFNIRVIILLICSGLRIGELLALKKEDVHLEERYFIVRAAKTESGIRVVPIPDIALPIWHELMSMPGRYVYPNPRFPDDPMSYRGYNDTHFRAPLEAIGITNHSPHDTRYTFISVMTSAKVMPAAIKRIVGHKAVDVTERVYTEFEIRQLVSTVNAPDFQNPYMESSLVL